MYRHFRFSSKHNSICERNHWSRAANILNCWRNAKNLENDLIVEEHSNSFPGKWCSLHTRTFDLANLKSISTVPAVARSHTEMSGPLRTGRMGIETECMCGRHLFFCVPPTPSLISRCYYCYCPPPWHLLRFPPTRVIGEKDERNGDEKITSSTALGALLLSRRGPDLWGLSIALKRVHQFRASLFFCRQRTLLSICPSSVLYIYTFPIIAGNDINLGSTEDTERGTRPAGSTLSESTLNLPCYISQSYRGFSAAGRNIWIALRVVGETGKRCRHGASVDSLRRHFHAAL